MVSVIIPLWVFLPINTPPVSRLLPTRKHSLNMEVTDSRLRIVFSILLSPFCMAGGYCLVNDPQAITSSPGKVNSQNAWVQECYPH